MSKATSNASHARAAANDTPAQCAKDTMDVWQREWIGTDSEDTTTTALMKAWMHALSAPMDHLLSMQAMMNPWTSPEKDAKPSRDHDDTSNVQRFATSAPRAAAAAVPPDAGHSRVDELAARLDTLENHILRLTDIIARQTAVRAESGAVHTVAARKTGNKPATARGKRSMGTSRGTRGRVSR